MKTQVSLALFILICAAAFCQGQTAIEHCTVYQEGRPDLCQECEPYFGLSWNATQCVKCRSACPKCLQLEDRTVTCLTCKPEYFKAKVYPDKELTDCVRCDANCVECKDYVGCNKCNNNFFKMKDWTYLSCNQCNPDCTECVDIIGCSKCKKGFYKKNNTGPSFGKCFACDSNCEDCQDDVGCNKCNKEFYRYESRREKVGFKCRNATKTVTNVKM